MGRQKVYRCQITGYRIEYIINDDEHTALCGIIICDYLNMKAFLALLRSSIDQLKEIEQVVYITQILNQDEWNNYLKGKTSWEIISSDNKLKIYTLKCSIDDYLENYGIAIGL